MRGYLQSHFHPRLLVLLVAVFSLSALGISGQDIEEQEVQVKPATTTSDQCTQFSKPVMNTGAAGETVKLDDLLGEKEQYYGKTVTVDGEMHRIFTDHVFTIEDDDFLRDDDLLIISDVSREQTLVPLEDSIDPGKNVRVTGFVHPYNRQELECLYGPLNLESREGHSFTKGPVLIVSKVQSASLEKPAEIEVAQPIAEPEPLPQALTEPAPLPEPEVESALEPEPAQEPAAEPADEDEAELPATASPIPLTGLLGLLSLASALGIHYRRR
jgi:predicted RNA-binding protein